MMQNQPSFGMYPSNVRVLALVLQQTGTYNYLYRRPYESNITTDRIQGLVQATQDQGTSLGKLLPHMSMLVVPSQNMATASYIPHGWNIQRYRFTMHVEVVNHMGMKSIETILGYTEFADASMNGLFDPNMTFYINSVTSSRVTTNNSHYVESSIIIPGTNNYSGQQEFYKQRPEDVINGLDLAIYNDPDLVNQNTTVIDTRSRLSATPIVAKRTEQVPTLFLGNIISAVTNARATSSITGQYGDDDSLGTAKATLANRFVDSGGFTQALNRSKAYASNTFTYNELASLDPHVAAVTKVIGLTHQAQASLHQVGLTAYQDTSNECVIATIVSQSVMSCMARTGMLVVRFFMDNMSETIVDAKHIQTNLDIEQVRTYVESFIHLFRTEVFNNVSYSNSFNLILSVDADMNGDLVIGVALNGQESIQYAFPAFTDSLTTPLVTQNQMELSRLVNDIGHVVDNISY